MTKFAQKITAVAPLLLAGVTMGSGSVPTLEVADITSMASSVSTQMGGFITNSVMIAGIGLIMVFGFLLVNKLYGVLRIGKGKKSRRR